MYIDTQDYNEHDVFEYVNDCYVNRLRKWTGLDFHIETRDDTKVQTFYGVTMTVGEVSVSVYCDEENTLPSWALFTMSARSWKELYRVVNMALDAYHTMSFARHYGAQAFTGIQ